MRTKVVLLTVVLISLLINGGVFGQSSAEGQSPRMETKRVSVICSHETDSVEVSVEVPGYNITRNPYRGFLDSRNASGWTIVYHDSVGCNESPSEVARRVFKKFCPDGEVSMMRDSLLLPASCNNMVAHRVNGTNGLVIMDVVVVIRDGWAIGIIHVESCPEGKKAYGAMLSDLQRRVMLIEITPL